MRQTPPNNRLSELQALDLPSLESLTPPNCTSKDKVRVILGLLRQAAVRGRTTKSCPFYSIRKVARHFDVPPTTVTRLYGQLKGEGILGTIWGSKTIVEPTRIDRDIRIKGIIGLPATLRLFCSFPEYRQFFVTMQHVLWRQGFGVRLIFHHDEVAGASTLADLLLAYKVDVVLWLAAGSKSSAAVSRLSDRGIKSITISECPPVNGDTGFYLSRRNALIEGLVAWRRDGIRKARLVTDAIGRAFGRQRMLEECLLDAGIPFTTEDLTSLRGDSNVRRRTDEGIIFSSKDVVLRSSQFGVFANVIKHHRRIMLVEGPFEASDGPIAASGLDSIKFDWRKITRRIGADLSSFGGPLSQRIFEATWHSRKD